MTTEAGAKPRDLDSLAALEALRRDIITGTLEPGRWLRLIDLRQRYDTGTSPLREALSKLAAEQLVVQEANRGFRVPPLDETEFRDVLGLRRQLEPWAAGKSVQLSDELWEEALLLAHRRLKRIGPPAEVFSEGIASERVRQWEQAHRNFHATLIAACGSPWTIRFCAVLSDQFDRYRRHARPADSIQADLTKQHDQLLELALGKQAEACAALLDDHVRLTGEGVLQAMQASPRLNNGSPID